MKKVGLFLYVIVAAIFINIWHLNYYMAIGLAIVPPALLNFFCLTIARSKVFLFSLIVTMLTAPIIALASRFVSSNDWRIPAAPLAITNLVFIFFLILWVISFYKYFVKHEQVADISDRFHYLFSVYIFLLVIILALCFTNTDLFRFSSYLLFIPFFILPAAIILSWRKFFIKKTLSTALFFTLVFFILQLVLVLDENWLWPNPHFLFADNFYSHLIINGILFRFIVIVSIIVIFEYFMGFHDKIDKGSDNGQEISIKRQ